jgi:hypothetical protein
MGIWAHGQHQAKAAANEKAQQKKDLKIKNAAWVETSIGITADGIWAPRAKGLKGFKGFKG